MSYLCTGKKGKARLRFLGCHLPDTEQPAPEPVGASRQDTESQQTARQQPALIRRGHHTGTLPIAKRCFTNCLTLNQQLFKSLNL